MKKRVITGICSIIIGFIVFICIYNLFYIYGTNNNLSNNINALSDVVNEFNSTLCSELSTINNQIDALEEKISDPAYKKDDNGILFLKINKIQDQINSIKEKIKIMSTDYTSRNIIMKESIQAVREDLNRVIHSLSDITGRLTKVENHVAAFQEKSVGMDDSFTEDIRRKKDVEINHLIEEGEKAFKNGDFTRAKKMFGILIDIKPPIRIAQMYYLWSCYYINPGYAASDAQVAALIERLPAGYNEKGEVSRLRGLFALSNGDWEIAEKWLDESLVLNPEDAQLYCIFGKAAYRFNEIEKCISLLEKAKQKQYVNAELFYYLGLAYEKLSQPEKAFKLYEVCLTMDSHYSGAYFRSGLIMKEFSKFEAAIEFIKIFLTYHENEQALLVLGECLTQTGEIKEAKVVMNEIVNVYPGSPEAREAEKYIELMR